MRLIRLAGLPAILLLAGCAGYSLAGTTDAERAAGGAVIGAGTAAVLDENIIAGAALGGAAGALADDAGIVR